MSDTLLITIKNHTSYWLILDKASAPPAVVSANGNIAPGGETTLEVSGAAGVNYEIPWDPSPKVFGIQWSVNGDQPDLRVTWLTPELRWQVRQENGSLATKSGTGAITAGSGLRFAGKDWLFNTTWACELIVEWPATATTGHGPKTTDDPAPLGKVKRAKPPIIDPMVRIADGVIDTSAVTDNLLTWSPDESFHGVADRTETDHQAYLDAKQEYSSAKDEATRLQREHQTAAANAASVHADSLLKEISQRWGSDRVVEMAMVDERWMTVSGVGVAASGHAKEGFLARLHAGLQKAYVLLRASSATDFWAKANITSLGFYRVNGGHHTQGCAVDFNADWHPFIPIHLKGMLASEAQTAGRSDARHMFNRVVDIYARAALFTGLTPSWDDTVMRIEGVTEDQVVRFRHVHESLRAYFSLAYNVRFGARPQGKHLTFPVRIPAEGDDEDFDASSFDVQEIGHCENARTDADALQRIGDPTSLKYSWYSHAGDSSKGVPALGQDTRQCEKDGIDRLRDILNLTASEDAKLLRQIRRDHELLRIALFGPVYSLPKLGSSNLVLKKRGGNDEIVLIKGTLVTRDPCDGFMWYHPCVPIAMAQPELKIRCLGYSTSSQWGSSGNAQSGGEAGDMMHFDFDPGSF